MPPLYNAYGAKTLRSKFCKDKQNWTFNLDLLKTGLIWNSIFIAIWFQPGNWLSWEPDLGAPLNSVFFFFFSFFLSFSLLFLFFFFFFFWNLLWRLPLNKAKILYAVWLTWDPIRRSPLTRTKVCVVELTWDPVRRSPLTRTKILYVVGLTWDPVRRSPLTRTKICVVGLTWDPVRRSPLTRTKICVFGLTWDPVRRSPLTRTTICVVGLTWDPVRRSPLTRTKICVFGLTWDPVRRSLLTRTKILYVLGLTWVPVRNQNQNLRGLPDGRVWTFFSCFENFLMVRFFSFFFLMIRFDQTFHLMLLFFFDFAGLTSVLPNCRVDICPSWCLKLTGFFLMTRLEKLGASWLHGWPEDSSWWQGWSSLFFSFFFWDFPNSKVYLIFFPFQGHKHDSLLSSVQWFFFFLGFSCNK